MLSRDQIGDIIWAGKVVSDAAISSRVKSLRRALGDDGRSQRYVRTVHGSGFRFVGDVIEGGAVSADTPGPAAAQAQGNPVIAVLPFANLSGNPEQDYFSDAVSQDIISHLARHRWLSVIARNSTFGYRGTAIEPGQLARELGADYVVQGTVQRDGNRIRVSAQLADAAGDQLIWSEQYDRDRVALCNRHS